MKLTNSILAMLCIAVCNSLTISKTKNNREGRVVGDACPGGDADCDAAGNNEVCEQGFCVCDVAGGWANDGAGTCINMPSFGEACIVAAPNAIAQLQDDNCNEPGQWCNGAVCACYPNWDQFGGDVCIAGIGARCNVEATAVIDPNVCTTPGLVCDENSFLCLCDDPTFQPAPGGAAVNLCAPNIGGTCADDDNADTPQVENCVFDNQECTAAGTCDCVEFFGPLAGVCEESIGAPCPLGNECTRPGQACFNAAGALVNAAGGGQQCRCNSDEFFVQLNENECIAGEGADCSATGDDDCAPDMRCYLEDPANTPNFDDPMPNGGGNAICSCPRGLEPPVGQGFVTEAIEMAMCVRSLGTTCPTDVCGLPNSECSNGVCACAAPFVDTNGADVDGGACSARIGAACPNGNECLLPMSNCFADGVVSNVPGEDQTCECEAMFGANSDNTACVPSVGAPCPLGNECTLDNQRCVVLADGTTAVGAEDVAGGQECGCVAEYELDDGVCVPSLGAACTNDDGCPIATQACDVTAATPVCVSTVGGGCPTGDGDCPLTRQVCDQTDPDPANHVCDCEGGWLPDANDGMRCNEPDFDFCTNEADGCDLNEGDCDEDNDCASPLICGVNNCIGAGRELADCCVHPDDPTGAGADTLCNGSAPNVWGCCTADPDGDGPLVGNRCGVNQGDCDDNDDCQDGLVCAPDSCTGDGFAGVFPANQVDCCQLPEVAKFYSNFVDGMDIRIERWTNDEEPAKPRPKY